MIRWVIDCSFAATLFLPNTSSDHVRDFFQSISDRKELFVPVLWWYELANVIAISERRKLLKDADIQRILKLFNRFPLKTDNTSGPSFVQKCMKSFAHMAFLPMIQHK